MFQHARPAYQKPQDLILFTFTIHSKKLHRPQKWLLRSGKISKFTYPPIPSSVKQLKRSHKSFFCSLVSEKDLKILRRRGTLPHFGSRIRHEVWSVAVYKMNKVPEKRELCLCKNLTDFSAYFLNKIFREAKNLRSLCLEQ